MTTIRDVAQAAGVSVQTVSNVIHERSFVRPETRQRVLEAIARLNYHPSQVAQGMRRQSSHTIGFLVSDPNPRGLADPFHGEVMAGLSDVARAHHYSLLIDRPAIDGPALAQGFLQPFQTRRIDAAVITLTGLAGRHADVLAELGQAHVLYAILEQDGVGESAYSLLGANYEGACTATQTLIESGHQRVAFLDSEQRWPAVEQRWRGYQTAMQAHGLGHLVMAASSPDWTEEGGAIALTRLLEESGSAHPTAILAGNDVLAVGAMYAMRARGLRVPVDMAIIGFDDFEFARYVDPPLTTVRLPAYDMGQCAAELLINHLQGQPAAERRIVLPTQLIVREST